MGEDRFGQDALDEAQGRAYVDVLDVEGLVLPQADVHGSVAGMSD